jgi:hypothetical protein
VQVISAKEDEAPAAAVPSKAASAESRLSRATIPLAAGTSFATFLWLQHDAGPLQHQASFALFMVLAIAEVFICIVSTWYLLGTRMPGAESGAAATVWRDVLEGTVLGLPLAYLLWDSWLFEATNMAPGESLQVLYATKLRAIWVLGVFVAFAYGCALSRLKRCAYAHARGGADVPTREALRAKSREILAATGAALSVSVLAVCAMVRLGKDHSHGESTWWTPELSLAFGALMSFLLAAAYMPALMAIHHLGPPLDPASKPEEPASPPRHPSSWHLAAELLPGLSMTVPVLAPLLSALLTNAGFKSD